MERQDLWGARPHCSPCRTTHPLSAAVLVLAGGRRSDWMRRWKVWELHRDYFPIKVGGGQAGGAAAGLL